jgi:hypothetical protein
VETVSETGGEYDPFEHEELPLSSPRANAAGSPARADESMVARPAATGSTVSPARAELTLEQLQRRWHVVIEELKRAKPPTTAALLGEAQPVGCDGQTVVIGFRHSILRDKWDRGDHKQRLNAALQSVFGAALPVRTTVLGDTPAAGSSGDGRGNGTAADTNGPKPAASARPALAGPEAREAAPASGGPDMLQGDALLHETLAVFDGQIVEPDSR